MTLTVTDSAGLTGEATTTITIADANNNLPPVASITVPGAGTPPTSNVGIEVTFDGSGSTDIDGTIFSYVWDFGDGTIRPPVLIDGPIITHTFTTAGIYTVSLVIVDDLGASDRTTVSITIVDAANQPPVAVITAPPTAGTVGAALSFDGSGSSDPDAAVGDILGYAWDFGDGGTSTLATPTYTYMVAGEFTVTLTVTDSAGDMNAVTTTITISAAQGNLPPVAVITAPPTTGIVGVALSFNGSGSTDPNIAFGDALTYAWGFGDGGTSTLATPNYTYTAAGTFTVTLTVTDSAGLTNEVTTIITISVATPGAPVAVITAPPTTGAVGITLSFDGSGSTDPDAAVGDILGYAWDFGDGGTSALATPTYTYMAVGTFTVMLTVTDSAGLTSMTTTIITIGDTNLPPVAVITAPPTRGMVGTALSFNGSNSSDPDAAVGDVLGYAWDFGDGGTSTLATPTYTYTTAGTFTVMLTVTDSAGLTSMSMTIIAIANANSNLPPVAVITAPPTTGVVGTALSFNGSNSSDPNIVFGDALTYAWDFGDGGTSTLATPTYTYMAAGTFTVMLTVTDSAGLTSVATTTIITISVATPGAPVAVITAPLTTGVVGIALSFNGSNSSDPDAEVGDILGYAWDFGDGGTDTVATPTYTYTTAGTFTVMLMVTDSTGLTSMSTTIITIADAANLPPVAMISGPTTGTAGTMITFSGAGSNDPEQGVLTYAWNLGEGTTGTLVDITNSFAVGTYIIILTVIDDAGITDTATANIVITAGGGGAQPPEADAGGPYNGTEATPVTFDGSASKDPDAVAGDILIYDWDFGDAIVAIDAGPTPSHTYSAAGTFTVTLTVTDADGMSGSSTTAATIAVTTALPPRAVGAGEELYVNYCESCHGVGGVSGLASRVIDEDVQDIEEAIEEEPTMNALATLLTEDEIMLIAHFLNEGKPMQISVISPRETLYITFCASCHGARGTGGSAVAVLNTTVGAVKDAVTRVDTMAVQVSLLSDSYITEIVTYLDEPEPSNPGTGTNRPTTGNDAVGDDSGGGGSLLWLFGLMAGVWAWGVTGRRYRRM